MPFLLPTATSARSLSERRYLPKYRDTREAIQNVRLLAPTGERVSLAQLCDIRKADEGSEIYRGSNQRYVAIKYSVRGRPLGDVVRQAIHDVNAQIALPRGYHISWEGEYQSEVRAEKRMAVIVPITVLLIFIILYSMYKSLKWTLLILATVAMASIGGLLVLLITHTNFSVSSEVGFLALFSVSVQTGVIMLEYINQRRAHGESIEDAAVEGSVLRPIMMTMLVATLGLLPAAMSHGIGSDTQRPFAIVIVGGLIATLLMSIFLLPTLYAWVEFAPCEMDDHGWSYFEGRARSIQKEAFSLLPALKLCIEPPNHLADGLELT